MESSHRIGLFCVIKNVSTMIKATRTIPVGKTSIGALSICAGLNCEEPLKEHKPEEKHWSATINFLLRHEHTRPEIFEMVYSNKKELDCAVRNLTTLLEREEPAELCFHGKTEACELTLEYDLGAHISCLAIWRRHRNEPESKPGEILNVLPHLGDGKQFVMLFKHESDFSEPLDYYVPVTREVIDDIRRDAAGLARLFEEFAPPPPKEPGPVQDARNGRNGEAEPARMGPV